MAFDHAGPGVLNVYESVAPPGWEDSIKKMKKGGEVENPWALAWYMKKRGMHPGGESEAQAKSLMAHVDEESAAAARGEAWAQNQVLQGGPGRQTYIYQEQSW
jgi:hypothetical protein